MQRAAVLLISALCGVRPTLPACRTASTRVERIGRRWHRARRMLCLDQPVWGAARRAVDALGFGKGGVERQADSEQGRETAYKDLIT